MLFLALTAILALVSLPTPYASQGDNTTLPLTLPARVISTNQQAVCPHDEVQETARNETTQHIRNSIHDTIQPAHFGGEIKKFALNNIPAPTLTNLSTHAYSCRLVNVCLVNVSFVIITILWSIYKVQTIAGRLSSPKLIVESLDHPSPQLS